MAFWGVSGDTVKWAIPGLDWLSGWWKSFSCNELYIIDFLLLFSLSEL